ncbi:hypothetical protein DM860_000824 [Cuscuta australis]|uniref:Exonuclease domain-containing protein n=1 Tax=Cuscuta australis TaxID=267555 RepID=A0A328CZK6_9ASTE|nr:hypothetical protein DM860_000824 [Cuscuta australis]
MASQLENPKNPPKLNPNWAELCQKLKINGSRKPTLNSSRELKPDAQNVVLGKRKDRPHEQAGDSQPNPLEPTSSDFSVTDVIAMDCEMVGVSSLGNKSALGRVTLALLLSHPKNDIRDTSEYQPFLKDGRSRALKSLAAEILGAGIQQGEHCPVEDARAAMFLYLKHRKRWEKHVKDFTRMKKKQGTRKPKKKKKQRGVDESVLHESVSQRAPE